MQKKYTDLLYEYFKRNIINFSLNDYRKIADFYFKIKESEKQSFIKNTYEEMNDYFRNKIPVSQLVSAYKKSPVMYLVSTSEETPKDVIERVFYDEFQFTSAIYELSKRNDLTDKQIASVFDCLFINEEQKKFTKKLIENSKSPPFSQKVLKKIYSSKTFVDDSSIIKHFSNEILNENMAKGYLKQPFVQENVIEAVVCNNKLSDEIRDFAFDIGCDFLNIKNPTKHMTEEMYRSSVELLTSGNFLSDEYRDARSQAFSVIHNIVWNSSFGYNKSLPSALERDIVNQVDDFGFSDKEKNDLLERIVISTSNPSTLELILKKYRSRRMIEMALSNKNCDISIPLKTAVDKEIENGKIMGAVRDENYGFLPLLTKICLDYTLSEYSYTVLLDSSLSVINMLSRSPTTPYVILDKIKNMLTNAKYKSPSLKSQVEKILFLTELNKKIRSKEFSKQDFINIVFSIDKVDGMVENKKSPDNYYFHPLIAFAGGDDDRNYDKFTNNYKKLYSLIDEMIIAFPERSHSLKIYKELCEQEQNKLSPCAKLYPFFYRDTLNHFRIDDKYIKNAWVLSGIKKIKSCNDTKALCVLINELEYIVRKKCEFSLEKSNGKYYHDLYKELALYEDVYDVAYKKLQELNKENQTKDEIDYTEKEEDCR